MTTIPASQIVNVVPSVLTAGGAAVDLNGLMLTNSTRAPIGTVLAFSSQASVGAYFGLTSTEYTLAGNYFSGFDNSPLKPGSLLVWQYNPSAVAAYLRGGNAGAGLTLAQIQAITTGTIIVTADGAVRTTSSINLSSATSYSSAASLISTALAAATTATGSMTASIAAGSGANLGYGVLTVSAVLSGTFTSGQVISGTGVTAGTYIISQLTGTTGGAGTYLVSVSQATTSTTIAGAFAAPVCTYDSTSGAFIITSGITGATSTITVATGTLATTLLLTAANGAVTSQGAAAATPATSMASVIIQSTNWATFFTTFDPDSAGTVTNKLAFAAWASTTVNRYAYLAWDVNANGTVSGDTSSLAYQINQATYAGTVPIYVGASGTAAYAAFVAGSIASISFNTINGRTTMKFRSQAGLASIVTDATTAANLTANGYNFYGTYATGNPTSGKFTFFAPGSITGAFLWLDSFADEVWLNNSLQASLMTLLTSTGSIPYNQSGYDQIRAACITVISQAVTFGAIRPGVVLSALQIAEVNAAAGVAIDATLNQTGWYLQVLDPGATVRAARGSPVATLWYMDGGSVHTINLTSVEVQ